MWADPGKVVAREPESGSDFSTEPNLRVKFQIKGTDPHVFHNYLLEDTSARPCDLDYSG